MPDDALNMVGFLSSKGYQGLARQVLVRWADLTTATDGTQLRTFVQECAMLHEVEVALGKFLRLARSGSNASMQLQLAEELVNSFGRPALAAIRPYLSNEDLLTRPLLAAELSLSEGDRDLARWYLKRIDPVRLPPEKLTDWLVLEHGAEMDSDAFMRLAMLVNGGKLPTEAVPRLADEAAELGQVAIHDMIWDSLRQ
jgi:hypothetical protein